MPDDQASHFVAFQSPSAREVRERALVLDAIGIAYQRARVSGQHALIVAADDVDQARAELEAYNAERESPAGDDPDIVLHEGAMRGVFAYAAIIIAVALASQFDLFGRDWLTAGRSDNALIRAGEWYRAVTALCLHSGSAHLVGNLVIGALFGYFAGQVYGPSVAWAAILLGGTFGNLVNALARLGDHRSIGASTAVFAALGLLAATGWRHRKHRRVRALVLWAPFISGGVLVGLLGTGGERTDVGAHIFGFAAGIAVGLSLPWIRARLSSQEVLDQACAAGSIFVLLACWGAALL